VERTHHDLAPLLPSRVPDRDRHQYSTPRPGGADGPSPERLEARGRPPAPRAKRRWCRQDGQTSALEDQVQQWAVPGGARHRQTGASCSADASALSRAGSSASPPVTGRASGSAATVTPATGSRLTRWTAGPPRRRLDVPLSSPPIVTVPARMPPPPSPALDGDVPCTCRA
jgi:hypothetical protein